MGVPRAARLRAAHPYVNEARGKTTRLLNSSAFPRITQAIQRLGLLEGLPADAPENPRNAPAAGAASLTAERW